MARNILILGATSGIARGIANAFAKRGDNVHLAARDENELARIATDLHIKYPIAVKTYKFDIENYSTFPKIENLEGIVFAVGYMGPDVDKILRVNYTEAVKVLEHYAHELIHTKNEGFMIALSSVAGDRGRQSNYLYGSAKAGLSTYLQGLRNYLTKKTKNKIKVITIKPGFVDTNMTFGLPGLFLVADPNAIGEKIAQTADSKSNVVYLPWFWKYIMLVIKSIPEVLFKRLSL